MSLLFKFLHYGSALLLVAAGMLSIVTGATHGVALAIVTGILLTVGGLYLVWYTFKKG